MLTAAVAALNRGEMIAVEDDRDRTTTVISLWQRPELPTNKWHTIFVTAAKSSVCQRQSNGLRRWICR
jgi:hypothetical protein